MTRENDLEAVRVQGKRLRTTLLEVRHLASLLRGPRVGIIVPRFGHSAVDRNTVKRRLRELARTELLPALSAMRTLDVTIRATPSAYGASFDALQAAVRKVTKSLRQHAEAGTP